MGRSEVSSATGAMKPVLEKLAACLGDERSLPEESQSDIRFINYMLESMLYVLPRMWDSKDLDTPRKDWMMEVRELSYDMEDTIDEFIQQRASTSPFEELKIRVRDVSERFCEEWEPAENTSNCSKPVVDPRARFLHRDASELVGMEALKDELVELVVQGVGTRGDAPRRRIGTPYHADKAKGKMMFKLQFASDNGRSNAIRLVETLSGVELMALTGDGRDRLIVVGTVDPVDVIAKLRKEIDPASYIDSVGPANKPAAVCEHPAAAHGSQRFDEVKTVCIFGFAGGGKTTLADLLYHAAGEQFDCRAFVSVSPRPNTTEILRAILTEVTNTPYPGTKAVAEQNLIDEISNFLADKRYLVIIDDIWHWEEWEIIRRSLPKNYLGSRVIMTTRINAVAEKCLTNDNDAFVYEIGVLNIVNAWRLSTEAVKKSVENYRPGITDIYPCYDIAEMCYGMPLAIICMSSALAQQIQGHDGELQDPRTLRRVEDGMLNIPSLKPLAESLCLGYNDLPLHLRTFLLYCSIYSWRGKFEKDRLVRRWIAERFVYEEEAAEACFSELVDREWIKPLEGGKYGIHPVMLAFLRCKSQEDNSVTCLGLSSDISWPCTRRIRRLSLQQGHLVDLTRIDSSHTRSLIVFDSVSTVPFKHFERLRVLELEDIKDLENAHLVDICALLWLRYLGLKGAPIAEIPPQIGALLHLETLDIRDTGVTELPWEAGQISKTVRVLAGDKDSRQDFELPEGVCQALEDGIPPSSLPKCREVLSILVFDRFGSGTVPPLVGLFKVPGRQMRIPLLIKEHFRVLSSLDIRLCKLGEEELKFLGEMPNLKTLVVRFEVLPREAVHIGGAGFAMLGSFCVDSRVPRVTFDPGSMPKLTRLAFKFYAGPESEDPVGITHLRSIEEVIFRCSPWYKSDSPGIATTIAIVRREALEHRNRITLRINDKEEIFPEKQSAQVRGNNRGAGSSRAEADAEPLPDRISLAGNDKNKGSSRGESYAIASCSRTSEIEEVQAQ